MDAKRPNTSGVCDAVTDCTTSNCRLCGLLLTVEFCAVCDDDYVLNATANGCVKETDTTDDCMVLLADGTCGTCWPGYYMKAARACEDVDDLYAFEFEGSLIRGILNVVLLVLF